MNVVSVDPGVENTGIFIFRGGGGSSVSVRRPRNAERYDHLVDVRAAVQFHAKGADLALVEDYPYGLEAGLAAHAIEVGGVVRGALAEMGIPVVVVAISTWKALTIGHMPKGTAAERQAYCDAVLRRYGHGFLTTDEADAYLIYRAALRIWTEPGITSDAARRIRTEIAAAKDRSAARTA